jgi:hypothetical protein
VAFTSTDGLTWTRASKLPPGSSGEETVRATNPFARPATELTVSPEKAAGTTSRQCTPSVERQIGVVDGAGAATVPSLGVTIGVGVAEEAT